MSDQPHRPFADRPASGDIVPFNPNPYQQPAPGYGQPGPQQFATAGPYPGSVPPGYAVPVVGLKDTGVAYLLLIFLGGLGVHHFYLGRGGWGAAYLVTWLVGWATSWLGVGLLLLGAVIIAQIVDLFLVPGYVRQANALATGLVRPRY